MTIPLDPRPSPLPQGQPWPTEEPEAPPTERPARIIELPFAPKRPPLVSGPWEPPPAA